MEVKEKIILPEKYYHTYFLDLVAFVQKHSSHLLDEESLHFIETFSSLSEDAQCLFLRFSNRKGPFFRTDKLKYQELNIPDAVNELLKACFITKDFSIEPLLLKLFTKQELLSAFDNPVELRGMYKEHLMIVLFEYYDLRDLCAGRTSEIRVWYGHQNGYGGS